MVSQPLVLGISAFVARPVRAPTSTSLSTGSPRQRVQGASSLSVMLPYTDPRLDRYLYQTIIAIDANFRLKRRAVSSEARDPAMGSGWGYFVEDTAYREFLKSYVDQEEVRSSVVLTCPNTDNIRVH